MKDVNNALDTIENRSRRLIRFVNSYRDFTQLPKSNTEQVLVKKLLVHAKNLNKGEAEHQRINVEICVEPETLEVTADPHLIEQVLINLIKNAFRALKGQETGIIYLKGEIGRNGVININIEDNGPGITTKNLDKVFIPFYSTQQPNKQGGSGIRLSLSRQIMRAHNGTLTVQSKRGEGTQV